MVKKSARRTRRTHGPAFKARVALAALREDKTMAQLCKEFELHANQIVEWKRQLLDGAADVFGAGGHSPPPVDLAPLHAKISQLALENDFLERALTKSGIDERKAMIDRAHRLPIAREEVYLGRRHIATLMRRMGIEALAPQPGTSKRQPGHKIAPCLLRKLAVGQPNHVNSAPSATRPQPTH